MKFSCKILRAGSHVSCASVSSLLNIAVACGRCVATSALGMCVQGDFSLVGGHIC